MKEFIFFFFFFTAATYSQITGCTDPLSKNYDSNATLSDGSCQYEKIKIKPAGSGILSDTIRETSGIIYYENLLWTHNDDHDKIVYGLDSVGKIKKRIILKNTFNNDWEEISQDSSHIYIGDFGNNYAGNRTDLKILKIEKQSFLEANPIIETISFAYADQTDFSPQKPNKTNFDCEAFIVTKDSLYLFTKQWKSSKTSIYKLANKSGNHIATLTETFDTKGLVTGATYLESKKLIALCGYSTTGKPFIYLLYDFKKHSFLSGNKRRVGIKLPFHQIEGITTIDGLHYYLTNEAFIKKPILNIPQQIHYLDLSPILNSYIHN